MIVYPSAFCICQGPMHWELLQRSRANDNQLFVVTCSPSRNNMTNGYVAYGHSMIVDPWGNVQREAGILRETIIDELGKYDDNDVVVFQLNFILNNLFYLIPLIDFQKVADVRRQLPLFVQRRTDLYNTNKVKH